MTSDEVQTAAQDSVREGQDLLSVEQAAHILQCSARKLREDLRTGFLPGVRLGKVWIIPRRPLVARLEELAQGEAARRYLKYHPPPVLPIPPKRKRGRPRLPVVMPGAQHL